MTIAMSLHPALRIAAAASAKTCAPSMMSVVAGVLRPVVADAVDARHEHHRGAHAAGQDLRVVAGAARHPHVQPRRVPLGRLLDQRLEAGVHRAGSLFEIGAIATAHGPARSASATSSCSACSKRARIAGVGVAELHLHLGAAGDDARRVRVDQRCARSSTPCAAPAISAKRSWMRAASRTSAAAASLRRAICGRAGMVLLAGDGDPVVPVADDRLDDADAQAGRFQRVALLDMRFEIAEVARRLAAIARPAGIAGLAPARRAASCRRGWWPASISASSSAPVNERLPSMLP